MLFRSHLLGMWPVLVDVSCRLACKVVSHPIFVVDNVQKLEMDKLEFGYSVVQGETES